MKRVQKLTALISVALSTLSAGSAIAATDAEIVNAIEKGLDRLHSTQTAGGYWNYGGYEPAATGAAAYAMLTQQNHWGANAAAYQADVDKAMTYLLNNASLVNVSARNDGVNICPGGGSCNGIYWDANGGEDSYTTGLIAPAIALYAAKVGGASTATSGPLVGKSWAEVAQGITNTWSASQSTANQGNKIGGWRYGLNDGYDSDMSTTQWGIISLVYGQSQGAVTPAIVTTDLAKWLATAQLPGGGGAGCYSPDNPICDHSDTGGLLLGLNLIGKNTSDPAVQKALAFLNANWQVGANGTWYGNFGHPYAMWSVYKGLETTIGLGDTTNILNLLPGNCGNDRGADCNWWQDFNEWLVSNQNGDGSWNGYGYWTGDLATAFYLPILGGTVLPPNPTPNPEPGTLALMLAGLAGSAVLVKRRANKG